MDNRSDMDPLLISYLLRRTSPEEDTYVLEWIGADEQNRLYFEALSRGWGLATSRSAGTPTDIEGEWGHFKDLMATRKTIIRKIVFTTTIAASLILVFVWWNAISPGQRAGNQPLAEERKTKQEVLWQKLINVSDKNRSFILADGSTLLLSPHSVLSYRLSAASRELSLEGEARFIVKKDAARPFSVFSGDIVTTALGTSFSIVAFPGENSITIRLHEGKVVVRSVDSIRDKLTKDFYLLPGNELVYDKRLVSARLRGFGTNVSTRAKKSTEQEAPVTDSLSMSQNDRGSWYMFNNQSLDLVLQQLQEMFQTRIIYSKAEVKNKYFIGKFDKSDSLIIILRKITVLNKLKLTQKDNMFLINK